MPKTEPYEIAEQLVLFKAGKLGRNATIWSEYTGEGGYGPTQCMYDEKSAIVLASDDDDLDSQVSFAGAYIMGWVESMGGDLDKIRIWLRTDV